MPYDVQAAARYLVPGQGSQEARVEKNNIRDKVLGGQSLLLHIIIYHDRISARLRACARSGRNHHKPYPPVSKSRCFREIHHRTPAYPYHVLVFAFPYLFLEGLHIRFFRLGAERENITLLKKGTDLGPMPFLHSL